MSAESTWTPNWHERLQARLESLGCGSVSEFLGQFPGEDHVRVAKRLGDDVAAVQLMWLQFAEAVEARDVRSAARDLLSRSLARALRRRGWGLGTKADWNRASACADWSSFLKTQFPGEFDDLIEAVWRTLTGTPPPDGWRPEGPDDPLLVAAFDAGWPAGVKDAPTLNAETIGATEEDEVADEALNRLGGHTRALITEHAGGAVGHLWVLREREIARESGRVLWSKPYRHGLVIFGSAPNGDAWALDLEDGEAVVVVSHDLVWEREVVSPREALVRVANSLEEALELARADQLPIDYWAARDEPADGET